MRLLQRSCQIGYSIYLPVYLCIYHYLSMHLSINLSIYIPLFNCLFISICLSVCFSIFFLYALKLKRGQKQRFFATCASQVHPPLKGRLSWTDWRTYQEHHEFICLSSNVSYWQKKVLKSSAVSEMSGSGRICQLLAPGNLHF